mmetsp:Transcript_7787/g.11130  ORF Transcript_7787/g.11130 Transcript_7787/m.11130 type:complete len:568 (+) Transcript_7787:134-1837(+)
MAKPESTGNIVNLGEENNRLKDKGNVCFICGISFTSLSSGMKGRINHLKRCSKKYGVSARVMKHDDESENFVCQNTESTKNDLFKADYDEELIKTTDPKWHTNSTKDFATGSKNNKILGRTDNELHSKEQVGKQSSLKHFFSAPAKSLNNVLMAGARRAAKTAAIIGNNPQVGKYSRKRNYFGKFKNANGQCPPHKRITDTDFICDGFQYASKKLSTTYFLTHFHSDHYGGITKNWNEGIIYTSFPTANLVHQQLGVQKEFLHPLPMMKPIVIESRGKSIRVILLDANHCPGAVMFLFEIGEKFILHVGDFRWNRSLMLGMPPLRVFETLQRRLDEIFFDTTYCDSKYAGIPTQNDAINATINIVTDRVSQARMRNENILLLFGSYTIGKERIYLAVAEQLGVKVYVDNNKYKILSALEWPSDRMKLLTTNKDETFIWVVPLGHINFNQLPIYLENAQKQRNKKVFSSSIPYSHILGFRPTGWTFSAKKNVGIGHQQNIITSRTSGRCTIYGVPYSEHSNFSELVDCLQALKPIKVIPTVSVSKSEQQTALLLKAVKEKQNQQLIKF